MRYIFKTTITTCYFPSFILTGKKSGRRRQFELGYGGMCFNCEEYRDPVCPFGT
jgi:hypothetical protein